MTQAPPPAEQPAATEARYRGLGHAAHIQRHVDPSQWRECIEAIACPLEREAAAQYLRSIAARQRAAQQVRARAGGA